MGLSLRRTLQAVRQEIHQDRPISKSRGFHLLLLDLQGSAARLVSVHYHRSMYTQPSGSAACVPRFQSEEASTAASFPPPSQPENILK